MPELQTDDDGTWRRIARRHYHFMLQFVEPWSDRTPQAELDEAVREGGGVGVLAVAYTTNQDFRRDADGRGEVGPLSLPTERLQDGVDPQHIVYAAWIAANALGRVVIYEIPPLEPVEISPGTLPAYEAERYAELAAPPR